MSTYIENDRYYATSVMLLAGAHLSAGRRAIRWIRVRKQSRISWDELRHTTT